MKKENNQIKALNQVKNAINIINELETNKSIENLEFASKEAEKAASELLTASKKTMKEAEKYLKQLKEKEANNL